MDNLKKYDEIFISRLRVSKEDLENLRYQAVSGWDSVGHMVLIASIEEEFGILMDTEDIIGFSSYADGKNILRKFNIDI